MILILPITNRREPLDPHTFTRCEVFQRIIGWVLVPPEGVSTGIFFKTLAGQLFGGRWATDNLEIEEAPHF
jgi:hypothetical protein